MNSIKKIISIEVFMIFIMICNFFVPFLFEDYKYLIFILLVGIFCYFIIGIDKNKNLKSNSVFKSMLIYLMLFFMIIYLSGLFIGFNRTIYSHTIPNILKNILPTLSVIIVSELLRYTFINKSNNDKSVIVLSYIAFLLLDICIGYYNYDLKITEQIYQFIGICILGGITRNILMTLFCIRTDYTNSIQYRLIMDLYIFIVPIVPALGPYINSIIVIVLPIILCFVTMNNTRKKKLENPIIRKRNDVIFVIVLTILLTLVLINSGLIKYQTLVIGSNSMKEYLSRGDVVLIEKYNNKEKEKIKKGDVLVFRYDNKIITHRVIKISTKETGRYYVTKGDNNNAKDAGVRSDENVIGVVKQRYKKIGLPSIWINELFK